MAVSPSRFKAGALLGFCLGSVFLALYLQKSSELEKLENEGIIGATIDDKTIVMGNMNTTLLRQPSSKQHIVAVKEPIIPSTTPIITSDDGRNRTFTNNNASRAECAWWNNSTKWGDQEEFSGLLDKARDEAHVTFQGRSVLVIGGSTSRDLASFFMRMVLPPQLRNEVTKKWKNSTNGREYVYEPMFPSSGKTALEFRDTYTPELIDPLMDAGWEFEQILGPGAGCSDCKSWFSNIDFVASLRGGAFNNNNNSNHDDAGISYEFSWKPDIFTQSQVRGFQERYCKKHYDVVHIGKGLHDAAYQKLDQLTPSKIRERFLKIAELVQCFPETTLVVLRTPYLSTLKQEEESAIIKITEVLKELVGQGAFGASRSVLIDGHLLTTEPGHPPPFDGHHYKSSVSKAYLNLLAYATQQFFKKPSNSTRLGAGLFREQAGRWKHCGLGVSTNGTR
jgi:hypothetical protein